MNTANRPVHLDLTRMTFPPMAIVSILHRISGVLLFLLLPFALYLLHGSLHSQASFTHLQTVIAHPAAKFLVWVLMGATTLHLIAGIRHMVMDCGFAESLQAGRFTAYGVIIISLIGVILEGVWLW